MLDTSFIKIMLKKIYLFVLSVICSVSAFSRDIVVVPGGEAYRPVPKDTMKHTVFHSKFGDDVQFPALTGDAEQNAKTLHNFFSAVSRRKNIKIETFIALAPLVPKGGDEATVETLNKLMPMTYRCFYAAAMEYLLFRDMGGRNRAVQQIFGALRSEMSSRFVPLCNRNPEAYCAELDSVGVFLRNLDYIGDIYTEGYDFKPKEDQAPIVEKLIEALEQNKASVRKNAEKDKTFRELITRLYTDPESVNLHEYFTDKVCKRFESKELSLKYISPEKEWEGWSVDNPELCSFSFDMGETFLVILSNKKASELFDSDNERSVHSYYVTYIKENDKWLIDDIKVQDVYR